MTDSRVPPRPPPVDPSTTVDAGRVREETWLDLIVQPTLDNLAPLAPGHAEMRLVWVAGLMVAITLLAPADGTLGTAVEEHRHLLAGGFFVFGVAAWAARKGQLSAVALTGLSLALAGLAGWASAWQSWIVALPAFVGGTLWLVRWRRGRAYPLPPSDPDPMPPVPAGFPILLGRIGTTIAVVLILRLYVLETRNVPTASMQPTIMGDRAHAVGDRVLVNRFAYLLRDPRRWEIAVFDYPLQPDVSFVKRIVGLPGERVEIRDGDIWVNGEIAAKPHRVQESLWQERFPRPGPLSNPKSIVSSWSGNEDDGWRRDGDGLKVKPRGDAPALARFGRRLQSSDARVSVQVDREMQDDAGSGEVVLEVTSRGVVVRARVPFGGQDTQATLEREGEPPVQAAASIATAGFVQLAVVDGRARLSVDHRLVIDEPIDVSGKGRTRVRVGAAGAATVFFRAIEVHEDLVYTTRNGQSEFDIPEGAFVVLGDNSPGSEDSRMWVASEFHLAGRDEPIVAKSHVPDPETGQMSPNVVTKDGITRLVDIHGVRHEFPAADRLRRKDVRMPFVFRRHLTGRASLILWPWNVAEAGFRPRVLP